ncbi:MAG: rhodanese-like domain-containing protein, partial [Gemmatimonadota bacterium]
APRAWWMFRAFGHQRVALLDGGIRKWRAESRALESGVVARPPARFNAALRHRQFRDIVAMRANLSDHQEQVLDARSSGRFNGTEVEPRKGLRGGHIPGSRNLPYTELVAPDGTLHTAAQLRELFTASGIDLSRPIVTTCGSGVTACALLLGLSLAGAPETALYDGSWTEWGGQADTPVEPDVRQ